MSRTATNRSQRTYPISDVLAILQDPSALISLNPLVVSHSLLPPADPTSPSTTWTITDSLKLLGIFNTTTTYTGTFTPSGERAVEVVAHAAAGVVSKARWSVDEDGTVVEEGEIEAPWWLMGYVYGQWKASHALLMERMEERLSARRLENEGSG